MRSKSVLILAFSLAVSAAWAQSNAPAQRAQDAAPPRSDSQPAQPQLHDEGSGSDTPYSVPSDEQPPHSSSDSSSRSTLVDLSPPTGDLQEHPNSDAALNRNGVNEMHPWNPHRAEQDIEVGDFYFKQGNYRGAEGRYRDALTYKPNDAAATYRLAEIMEKTSRPDAARDFYEAYLKILPHGPKSDDARKALAKLQAPESK